MTLLERVQDALSQAHRSFPGEPKVVGMGPELIVDSTGDDAVRILVKIDEATPEEQWTPERLEPISEAIRQSLRQNGIDLWPYVHFLTPSDEEEARAEMAEAEKRERDDPDDERR